MASAILQMLAIEVSGALRAPAALHLEGKRMDPRRETRKVLKKTIEEFGRKAFVAEEGAEVRHLAYAKDTPPKYATRPTPGALHSRCCVRLSESRHFSWWDARRIVARHNTAHAFV